MAKNIDTADRKKDYITYLAVIMVGLLIVFELFLALWLPFLLKQEAGYEKETALETLISEIDEMRKSFIGMENDSKYPRKEIFLARQCLSEYAEYIRKYRHKLNRHQIAECSKRINDFQIFHEQWENQREKFAEYQKLNLAPEIQNLKTSLNNEKIFKNPQIINMKFNNE